MIKTVYSKFPEAQNEMVSLFAQDVKELFYEGLTTRDGLTLHFVHLGHKGDLPAWCEWVSFWGAIVMFLAKPLPEGLVQGSVTYAWRG